MNAFTFPAERACAGFPPSCSSRQLFSADLVYRPNARSHVTSPARPFLNASKPCHRTCGKLNATTTTTVEVQTAVQQQQQPAHPHFEPALPGTFIGGGTRFVEEHRIRGYEVGPDQQANMITIANLLQEVASNHAVCVWGRTDNGFANIPSVRDLVFVMTRLQIRMRRYPRWGDLLQVETYYHEEGRIAARRDWVIRDKASGEVMGEATSTWVMINMATRRITKMSDETRHLIFSRAPPQQLHAIPLEETKQKLPDLDVAPQVAGPKQVARRADMDMNGHINNVTYLAWALEGLPADVYEGAHLYEMELDFKAECQAGNTVESYCSDLGTTAGAVGSHGANGNGNGHSNANGNGNGNGSSNGNGNGSSATKGSAERRQFLHTLARCDGDNGCTELVRARSTWVARAAPAECSDA